MPTACPVLKSAFKKVLPVAACDSMVVMAILLPIHPYRDACFELVPRLHVHICEARCLQQRGQRGRRVQEALALPVGCRPPLACPRSAEASKQPAYPNSMTAKYQVNCIIFLPGTCPHLYTQRQGYT